ncbi:dolichol monophosphate mannose synthase [candidate division WOR-1 bacterium RIFOXYC2_FULL_37_10]|uniref:Dolichol monophosphate mannose synthase n=1 Tax=candidate division WOR-1 bacterium RIFOXYB2_FULL_37_13 TaxID=1802579 RepID=A0A1F4SP78_UNCSA|nr:MAG: dolichol monophosphate mannose synthase [candidate division WOR-1 bacterium RIFOXYB2_FULL_37_13]OGC37088.1 MAG: dolichol monophosphate mannose synthase [candidate division WOR-1 bacterium RIFOXYC2_FULL_37_10]
MKLISIVTPCYNEEENIEAIYTKIKEIFSRLDYSYEHIFIDNASKDRTVEILKELAKKDKNLKIIVNTRNFGHIRSPFYGFIQTKGDAVISIAADFQDPPEMIIDFIKKWEEGYKIIAAVKKKSKESPLMFGVRGLFYEIISRLSDIDQIKGFTGFGLYDKKVIDILRTIDDPYPYFRGLISDLGFDIAKIEYTQPRREKGITKNNFYSLYDMAMLGITNHSKVPLRLATMLGFLISMLSILVATGYFIYKLIFWNNFNIGIAPLVIGFFFFASVQLFFIGILGEYIGSIHTQVLKRPLVIEKERVNF